MTNDHLSKTTYFRIPRLVVFLQFWLFLSLSILFRPLWSKEWAKYKVTVKIFKKIFKLKWWNGIFYLQSNVFAKISIAIWVPIETFQSAVNVIWNSLFFIFLLNNLIVKFEYIWKGFKIYSFLITVKLHKTCFISHKTAKFIFCET